MLISLRVWPVLITDVSGIERQHNRIVNVWKYFPELLTGPTRGPCIFLQLHTRFWIGPALAPTCPAIVRVLTQCRINSRDWNGLHCTTVVCAFKRICKRLQGTRISQGSVVLASGSVQTEDFVIALYYIVSIIIVLVL